MLAAYDSWANRMVLSAMQALTNEQLAEGGIGSRGSIAATMRHVLLAGTVWQSRWTGENPPAYDLLSLDGLRAAFEDSGRRLTAFTERLQSDDWRRIIAYRDSQGVDRQESLGILLTHVVNHGTLHRGEAGLLLARYDASPGDLDFVFWARDHWRPTD